MAESMKEINDPTKIAERKAALARQIAAAKAAPVAAEPQRASGASTQRASVPLPSAAGMTVLIAVTMGFLIYVIGRDPDNVQLPESQALAAWAGLAIILAVGVDLGPTAQVSSALALMILLTVILLYGSNLIEWSNRKISAQPEQTTRLESGRYKGKVVPL